MNRSRGNSGPSTCAFRIDLTGRPELYERSLDTMRNRDMSGRDRGARPPMTGRETLPAVRHAHPYKRTRDPDIIQWSMVCPTGTAFR
jgi:hypothetical protein